MYDLLQTIHGPQDVKALSAGQLEALAAEMREALFNRLTKKGGHFGPNFGMVEAAIALHYVFHSPEDKMIYDVSHQSYPHKLLTGRVAGYIDETRFSEDSGYSNPEESEHDHFNIGHTSTSISLATGMARARDLQGGKENVIAIIGDGSLSGGEAMEALNVAGGEIHSNLIIVVNDNEQSIAEVHGGLYENLGELRRTNGEAPLNWFRAFGLDYIYEENGNDIQALIAVFNRVKDIDHPVVVHIHTQKGKGYPIAEANREQWHWTMPFDRETGKPTVTFGGENYTALAGSYIQSKVAADKDVLVISPAVPGSFGLGPAARAAMGSQYLDPGIAEEQAVAMASGAARRGCKPLVLTNMTFLQRAYDQISHDVCLNNSPVTILTNYTAFDGLTDAGHLGIFGLAAFTNIPNLVVLAPSCKEEFLSMLDWSLDQREHPVLILIPGNEVTSRDVDTNYDAIDTYRVEQQGEQVAIVALGDFYQRGETLAAAIEEALGFRPTLINPRFASGVDTALLDQLEENHRLVVTLEDGILSGGFGEKIASYYGPRGMKVRNYGLGKEFYDRYDPQALLEELGMTTEQMVEEIRTLL